MNLTCWLRFLQSIIIIKNTDMGHHPAAEAEDVIDENNLLWLAVLKLMNGDCAKALEM